jgi:hypothetical protein
MNTLMIKNKINVYSLMKNIYDFANIVFYISATHYLNWFRKGTNANRLISVQKHPDYKGIEELEHVCLPKIGKQKNNSIFIKSPHLSYVLDTLTVRDLYQNHPTMLLTKCSHLVVHQEEFVRTISNHTVWKLNWVAIAYNGSGITIYHDSFRGLKQLVIDGVFGQPSDTQIQNGVFKFKNLGIMQTLSYLYNSGGLEKYPRVAISSGNLASRCINFMDNQYMWHVTDEYLDPSDTSSCVDLIQSLRICGIHKNVTPLKLWSTRNVYYNITKTHTNVKQFILHVGEKNPDTDIADILGDVKMHEDKFGDRNICKEKEPFTRVKNAKDDNTSSFTGMDTGTSTDTETNTSDPKTDVQNYEVNGLKNVKQAYDNQTGIVYKIIKMFIDNEFESLSKQELDKCGNENTIKISNYIEWDSNRRKIIEQTSSGKYKLTNQIVQHLNLIE